MPPLWVQLWFFHSSRFYCLTSSGLWMCVHTGPSLICTLLGACGFTSELHCPRSVSVVSGPPKDLTLPCQWLWSRVCSLLLVLRIWVQYPPHLHASARRPGGEETGAAAAVEFPKVPLRVFFFLRKSSCSILPLPPYKEGPVLSHSPPLQLDRDCLGQGHTAQFSTPPGRCPWSPWVYHFSLFPSLWPQATRSLSVLLKLCLAGVGAISSALSQESCGEPSRRRPGAAVALFPMLVPGTFLSWSSPLTVCFFSVLCTFWSPIFINTGVLLAVRFVPQ